LKQKIITGNDTLKLGFPKWIFKIMILRTRVVMERENKLHHKFFRESQRKIWESVEGYMKEQYQTV
jgi:hypothetical protein